MVQGHCILAILVACLGKYAPKLVWFALHCSGHSYRCMLVQAAGRGISRPAFRVIQQHFATGGNVGDVAAREEVWEVAGQLAGLALSVAILQALDTDGIETSLLVNPAIAVSVLWLVSQLIHIGLRCAAVFSGVCGVLAMIVF